MKSGQLRHRVDLQTRVDSVDAIGQPSTTWTSTAYLWADVRYLTGVSAIKAGADTSASKVSIRLRHGTFNAGQRVVFGNEVFDVQAVLPDGKKSYVDLVCECINADV